ncbi:P-loop containing nucleoside triphosphate hydrolase protein [Artomyces pyxidatus]|uniref:P-loop containing nucleoside triphosphate hydrolase protein n=1 Tax=Artomyces pyxidatus TaxID=48021 RepID=A0ACB8TJG5_9AGAM|nr:P-loop containing nucleoside triphosphate hydrolase protein [Artomyces pyxidatus]
MSSRRLFSTLRVLRHENPLGLPRRDPRGAPPQLPRRSGPIAKRPIPNVKQVLVVASGKGGVGKSTVAVNLAFALALRRRARVGILDLDIFGPSVPKLMGLDRADEPHLTSSGALVPLVNHGIPTMSMGFLLPRPAAADTNADVPVVWRGLMVQKAVQQLLFDVDWRADASGASTGAGLDVLVIDMPPGTGDVPLTLGQLVTVDGAVIVSTPQDVALSDVRKGIAMFRKVDMPILGLVLNQSYFVCPSCTSPHYLFGPPDRFREIARQLRVPVLGELPLAPGVSSGGDAGMPYTIVSDAKVKADDGEGGIMWKETMQEIAENLWGSLQAPS